MLDTPLSQNLNGMLELACMLSTWVGRSDVGVSAYTKENWEKAFCRQYRVRSFTPVRTDETFRSALFDWLGSEPSNLSDVVAERFEHRLGKALCVYRAKDEEALLDMLSACNRGFGAYFFTEGAFFVEFQTHVLAFTMGNFE